MSQEFGRHQHVERKLVRATTLIAISALGDRHVLCIWSNAMTFSGSKMPKTVPNSNVGNKVSAKSSCSDVIISNRDSDTDKWRNQLSFSITTNAKT
jgi:hypothetical protein